jgi:beta-fructofuranosidase
MNDPNGLIQWRGMYHVFYQHNPFSLAAPGTGASIHWGHAMSEDLVHWEDCPVALAPTAGGPDEDGCWSGCAVLKDGTPHLLYTGVRGDLQLPCLARAVDLELLTVWEKHPGNPVIEAPPPDLDLLAFRDHCVWQDRETFYQLIGSGIAGVGGAALLYRSPDLVSWEYLRPLLSSEVAGVKPAGAIWECPDFFPLGDRHVLVVSSLGGEGAGCVHCFTGRFDGERFAVERQGLVDGGDHFYAAQSMRDGRGRRLMWGWVQEDTGGGYPVPRSRAGLLSLPREMDILDDGTLVSRPVPELKTLRSRHWHAGPAQLAEGSSGPAVEPGLPALEVMAVFEAPAAGAVGLRLHMAGGGHALTITTEAGDGRLVVVRGGDRQETTGVVFPGGSPETANLHVFMDHGVVEAYGDFGCTTEVLGGARMVVSKVEPIVQRCQASLLDLDVWEMQPIWQSDPAT